MGERTIDNPVTGERATFIETSRESGGRHTVAELDVRPGGGVPLHHHTEHEERIDVLEGEIEVTANGVAHRYVAGQRVDIPHGTVHRWRNPSPNQRLRFRGTITPGHPGFERVLRVLFGLGRDGGLRSSGIPRRFVDLALIATWDPSLLSGSLSVLGPVMRWTARRPRAQRRAASLLERYDDDTTSASIA